MNGPRAGTTLTIEIDSDDRSYWINLQGYGLDEQTFPDLGTKDDLASIRQTAMTRLADFKRAAVNNDPDTLGILSTLGIKLLGDMLGDRVNDYLRPFNDYIQKSFVNWGAVQRSVPRVTLRAPAEAMIPVELLLIEGLGIPRLRQDKNAGYYDHLGFAAVVNRVMIRTPDMSGNRYLRNVPRLPVTFLHNASLPSADAEAFFLDADPRIDVDGPWPNKPADLDDGLNAAIGILYDPSRPVHGNGVRGPSQIQHLACHGRFDQVYPDRSVLTLGCASAKFDLSLADLQAGFDDRKLKAPATRDRSDLPLVFLNACQSALAAGMMSPDSFPRHFLRFRSRAVIGVEAPVPDDVATRFSRMLYEGMLDDGASIGAAIFQARQRLLARDSPLGILYTLYGDPDLVVQRVLPRSRTGLAAVSAGAALV